MGCPASVRDTNVRGQRLVAIDLILVKVLV
jgi:hypothetical protein